MFGKKGVHQGSYGPPGFSGGRRDHHRVTFHSPVSFVFFAALLFLVVLGFAVFNIYKFNLGSLGKAYSVVVLDEVGYKAGVVIGSEAFAPRQLRLSVREPLSLATAVVSGTASGVVIKIGGTSIYEHPGKLQEQPELLGDFSHEIRSQCESYPCEVELVIVSTSSGTVALSGFSLVPQAVSDGPGISVEAAENYFDVGAPVALVGIGEPGKRPVSLVENPGSEPISGNLVVKVQVLKGSGYSPGVSWEDVEGGVLFDEEVSVPQFGFFDIAAAVGFEGAFKALEPGKFRILGAFTGADGTTISDSADFVVRSLEGKISCNSNFDCPAFHSCDGGVCTNFCGGVAVPSPEQPSEKPKPEPPGDQSLSNANFARLRALGFEIESGSASDFDISGYSIEAEGSTLVVSKGNIVRKISGKGGAFVITDLNGRKVRLKSASPESRVVSHIIELRTEPLLSYKASVEKELVASSTDSLKASVKARLDSYGKKLEDARAQARSEMAAVSQGLPGSIVAEYGKAFSGFAASLTAEEAEAVRRLPSVKAIYPNGRVFALLDNSVNQVSADEVWKLSGKDGTPLTGKGVTIAVIDTGVDYTHPDLGGCFGAGCKVVDGYDFYNGDSDPMDDNGHGTHVAATAAGSGALKGVAPGASVYAYKVLSSGGSGGWDGIIAAIERSVDPNDDGDFSDHVDVLSMSLGGRGNPDDPISQAVDNAVDAGVVAVIAAGNSGPYGNTIGSPGTARKAITVGAVDRCDNLAGFSSRGPVIWEGGVLLKPDIVAPGVDICAAEWDSWLPEVRCLDDKHIAISGTSMATPHVSGAAALLLQAHPDWVPLSVKSALMVGAHDLGLDATEQGAGRLDVLNSLSPSLSVSPQSLSFEISEGTSYSTELEIKNLLDEELAVDFEAVTFDSDGKAYDFATVEPESIALAPMGSGKVTFSVNVNPETEGYFTGRITMKAKGPIEQVFLVHFSFTRLSHIVVSVTGLDGKPLLADFFLNSNDLEQASSASYGFDFSGDSYDFLVVAGGYTVHAINIPGDSRNFILSKAVSVPVGSRVVIPLSLADARPFNVQAESFGKVPLSFNLWEKSLLVYDATDGLQTTYTEYSPVMPRGNKIFYVSERPENGLNTDVIIDYEGYPPTLK